MNTSIKTDHLWTGKEYYSLERCRVCTTKTGSTISSLIIGMYKKKIYNVMYTVKTNSKWETVFFEISFDVNGSQKFFSLERYGKGIWTKQGKVITRYNGCIDIDISLTPFTNTLPINRLALDKNEQQQIKVIYIDIFNAQLKPVKQSYTRLSKTKYKFENVPNNFEAVLQVDQSGFVLDYPGLFIRTAKYKSDHR